MRRSCRPRIAHRGSRTLKSDAILARLLKLHPKLIDLSLGRIQRLLDDLGNPEQRLPPVVHVGGTNGKGSVIAFLVAVLEAAGYAVHVYTSPHLVRFAERIRLAGRTIEEDALTALLAEVEAVNGGAPITGFEITTAAAMLSFSRAPADVLLLEVGLGGRLDATNVVERPLVSAISPVSIDHTVHLGKRLRAIAGEKAGILKAGVPAVIGRQTPVGARVIAARAEALAAPLSRYGTEWRAQAITDGWRYRSGDRVLTLPRPALAGAHQIDNAAMALACVDAMAGFDVDEVAILHGLANAAWPGRLQRLDGGPLGAALPPGSELWLDGGHNRAAAKALAATLAQWDGSRPLSLVIGMIEGKAPGDFLRPFAALAPNVIGVAVPDEEASLKADDIVAAAKTVGLTARPADDVGSALSTIAHEWQGNVPPRVLICGSLYLAGRVLAGEGLGAITPWSGTSRIPAA
jgi:dihydrofolate synthase/folylpolyglutamate synthase